ncbi:MAG: sigma-70 family RNA polymerase sigma factor [Oscillospiraceae bacterium]|jgi:RNA polymerase sigma factor (sigma-70 family)|nr:sigma-70 family RNA polymerase sigma factor [Oscillospiraceae bacterium]
MEKDYIIRVRNELVPVSEEIYREYYSHRRRERTLEEKDARHGLLRYDAWDAATSNGADALPSPGMSPEELTERRLMSEKLNACLPRLSGEERDLVHALFYCGEPLAALARRLGVPRKTLADRRDKILKRLRILMESPER